MDLAETRGEARAVILEGRIMEDREARRHLHHHMDTEDTDPIGHMDAALCRFVYSA